MFQAVVIKDSIVGAPGGKRLTTLMLRYPRFIHAQFMTHRAFSRNASSSRAIPVKRMIEDIRHDPVFPIEYGKNKRGMVAEETISDKDAALAEGIWQDALEDALRHAERLAELGVHKQVVNRILEPFAMISVVVSATEWDNFFALRLAHDTQPEMQLVAKAIKRAMNESAPQPVAPGHWHIPFVRPEESKTLDLETQLDVAVARCARVSYKSFETGKDSTVEQDRELCKRLYDEKHLSPFEHVAMATDRNESYANFVGWISRRRLREIGLRIALGVAS